MKKEPLKHSWCWLSSLLVILALVVFNPHSQAQGYFNRLYPIENADTLGAVTGHILHHNQHLYTIGVRNGESGMDLIFSKWNLQGDLQQETIIETESPVFFPGAQSKFKFQEGNFYYAASGLNSESTGIYCFNEQMALVWSASFTTIEEVEFDGPSSLLFQDQKLYLAARHRPETGQWISISEFDTNGQFIRFLREPQDEEPSQHNVETIHFHNGEILLSGGTQDVLGIPDRQGFVLRLDSTNGEWIDQLLTGNPDHFDTEMYLHSYDENNFLAVQLVTDSISTTAPLPNENYWYNKLTTSFIDKQSLIQSNQIVHHHFAYGLLYDFEVCENGYAVLTSEDAFLGADFNCSVFKLDADMQLEYETSFTNSPCSNGCRHTLLDMDFDEFGNGFAVGTARLPGENEFYTDMWMVAFDCHGRTVDPNLQVDVSFTEIGNAQYVFGAELEEFDDFQWTIEDETYTAQNFITTLDEGLNTVVLNAEYCGKQFVDSVVIDVPISVFEQPLEEPLLFPNPVQSRIQIEGLDHEVRNIKIYSSNGKLLLDVHNMKVSDLNVSHLPKGSYFLVIQNESETRYRFEKE